MAAVRVLSWGSYTFASDLHAYLADGSSAFSQDVTLQDRPGRYPIVATTAPKARTINLDVMRPYGSSLTTRAALMELVQRLFPQNSIPLNLAIQHPVNAHTLTVSAYVQDVDRHPQFPASGWRITLVAPDPLWREITAQTGAAPTLTNNGGLRAPVIVKLTPSTSGPFLKGLRVSFHDQTGQGISNYPVIATFDTSGIGMTGPSDLIVFYGRQSVPFAVTGVGTSATKVLIRVNLDAGETGFADIFYSAYIQNTDTPNTLNVGQTVLTSATNLNHVWSFPAGVSNAPAAASLVWVPCKIGTPRPGTSTGITLEGTTLRLSVRPDESLSSDFNGIMTVVGTGASAAAGALSGLVRTVMVPTTSDAQQRIQIDPIAAGSTGSGYVGVAGPAGAGGFGYDASDQTVRNAVATAYGVSPYDLTCVKSGGWTTGILYVITFSGSLASVAVPALSISSNTLLETPTGAAPPIEIKVGVDYPVQATGNGSANGTRWRLLFRQRGNPTWFEADSAQGGGVFSAAATVVGATEIALIVEAVKDGGYCDLDVSGTVQLAMHSSFIPTVSNTGPSNAFLVSGTVTNSSSQTVTFDDVYMYADVLVFDADAGRLYTQGGADWYGGGALPNDAVGWFTIERGANSVAESFDVPAASGVGRTASVVGVAYVWVERWAVA